MFNEDGTLNYKTATKIANSLSGFANVSTTDLKKAISYMTKEKNLINDKFDKGKTVTLADMDHLVEINQIYQKFYSEYFNRKSYDTSGKANEGGGIYKDSIPMKRGGCGRNGGAISLKGLSI